MAPIAQLTTDCLREIINGVPVDKPVLQILGSNRINPGNNVQDRYRLLVSDGKNLQSFAMLATEMNEMFNQGHLEENTIVRVDRYITSLVNRSEKRDKRVLILLEITVLNPGAEVGGKIGNPISMDSNTTAATPATSKPHVIHQYANEKDNYHPSYLLSNSRGAYRRPIDGQTSGTLKAMGSSITATSPTLSTSCGSDGDRHEIQTVSPTPSTSCDSDGDRHRIQTFSPTPSTSRGSSNNFKKNLNSQEKYLKKRDRRLEKKN